MNKTVESFIPLVDFLETVIGHNTEIVLHDFSDLEHSVVDIRNGGISGREVGAPATDFVLKVLNGDAFSDRDHTEPYLSHSVAGKPLRSGSFFIRENGKLVGMLCVNVDTSLIDELGSLVAAITRTFPTDIDPQMRERVAATSPSIEHFSTSVDELVGRAVRDFTETRGKAVDALSVDERMELVKSMEEDGVFLLKGAVSSVAQTLGISEPSVYRYLQKVRKK